jgi:methylenetetrahydrofolate dehydrogenase (NADP+) / methenyltetrahydrofolate cyclohydrolase
MVINGKEIAERIIEGLKSQPLPTKELAVFLVGDDPSSISFIKKKEKIAENLGVRFKLYHFGIEAEEGQVIEAFKALNKNEDVGGIVLQLPLPDKYNREDFFEIFSPDKDVDNLTGKSKVLEPVVLTTKAVLEESNTDIKEMTVAVVGKGFLVGQPIIRWAESRCKKLVTFDENSGLDGFSEADKLKPGTRVIDFGYDVGPDGVLEGDFHLPTDNLSRLKIEDSRPKSEELTTVEWFTPTPGGTGPILVAKLFENFYTLNNPND